MWVAGLILMTIFALFGLYLVVAWAMALIYYLGMIGLIAGVCAIAAVVMVVGIVFYVYIDGMQRAKAGKGGAFF